MDTVHLNKGMMATTSIIGSTTEGSSRSKRFITLELIRKRRQDHENAENGETLKDLTLLDLHEDHLQEIGSVVGRTCPNLKRLYLHNNLLRHVRELTVTPFLKLRVLVLALNNLSSIQCIEKMQALEYVDVSFNYIDQLQESLDCVKQLPNLADLFFIGNPCERCTCRPCYRATIIGTLGSSLKRLDGITIDDKDRAQAHPVHTCQEECRTTGAPPQQQTFALANNQTTVQQREAMSEAWLTQQACIDNDRRKSMMSSDAGPQKSHSTIVQETRFQEQHHNERRNVNEGNYTLVLTYHRDRLVLVIAIPKDIPTDDINMDIQSEYVSLIVQKHVLRIRLPQLIRNEDAAAQRSQATGKLELVLPTVEENIILDENDSIKQDGEVRMTRTPVLAMEMLDDAVPTGMSVHGECSDSDEEPPQMY